MMQVKHLKIQVEGTVQGVGFRPFVYREAQRYQLQGHVFNSPAGVQIQVQGPVTQLQGFLTALQHQPPPLVQYQRFETENLPLEAFQGFEILPSQQSGVRQALLLPDLAVCETCLQELFDPQNRRYRYPFTNCTLCGPRYSIIARLPYDRPHTSMAAFQLCQACLAEYQDPQDRRFHAQPNACAQCGPQLQAYTPQGALLAQGETALAGAIELLSCGGIVALKSLGGFQLLCDARQAESVRRLRQLKRRPRKSLAVLFPHLQALLQYCEVPEAVAELLTSYAAPIVLLKHRGLGALAVEINAPNNPYLGVMLPATPLHHVLMHDYPFPLVATSANRSGAALAYTEEQLFDSGLADYILGHNRPILRPSDDSVVQWIDHQPQLLRRARGYAPLPLPLPAPEQNILALGAQLKTSFGLAVAGKPQALLSPYLGDLFDAHTRQRYQETLAGFRELYPFEPEAVACDFHPDYATSQMAQALVEPLREHCVLQTVQHHEAHLLACVAEHQLEAPVLGVIWDGAGLGKDAKTLWGGEFFALTPERCLRLGHFLPFDIPGGEQALRKPAQIALGFLYSQLEPERIEHGQDLAPLRHLGDKRPLLLQALARQLNCVTSTSVGRLFDAVASLLDLCHDCAFEGEAAMAVEYAALNSTVNEAYPLPLKGSEIGFVLDSQLMFKAILSDLEQAVPPAEIARRFHHALVAGLLTAVKAMQKFQPCQDVVLSGGCFQNRFLLESAIQALRQAGFRAWWPQLAPPNDGGLALGQLLALSLYHKRKI